ncbi:carbohydrate ABC transporter permease [Halostagnicola kamekurae]|uniref:Carbohydrate ABC transporter membrane protein 1, CUT1 family n=1 Tax=Halostagnicola kamekurae TaxID=619731 RepID=A0A1I6UJK8_9EURY|nr:sugar ABC transporter permease [Halostagnicola kamekurae]SFT01656.1 carbohydrate ABC transporter membrane protein 1, CUT1 family [Halostagnicola kamekurae]
MATETGTDVRPTNDLEEQLGSEKSTRERVLLWVDDHLKWLMTLPAVFLLFALTFYPLLRAVQMSTRQYLPAGRTSFVGIENYVNLLDNAAFIESLIVTGKFIGLAVGLEFVLGFGIALILNKKIKLRGLWQTLILIPMILSPTVIGLIWRLMYTPDGLLDFMAAPFLGRNVGWISDPDIALYAIVLTDVWQWTPLVVLVIFAGLQSVPSDIQEAAIMDGAPRWRRFVDIVFPYLKSLIVLVLIIRVVDALRVFAKVYILTRGGPSNATNVISMEMYRTAFRFSNFGQASAMAISLLVVVLILAMSFVKIADIEF